MTVRDTPPPAAGAADPGLLDESAMPETEPAIAEGPPEDALLRRLAHLSGPGQAAAAPLDDQKLAAWRAGTLDAGAAAALEARLLTDPEARALLVAGAQAPSAAAWALAEAAHPAAPAAFARLQATRLRRWRWTLGGAAALAAALALYFLRPYGEPETPPPYGIELSGGVATTRAQVDRAAEDERRTFVPTSIVSLRLAPETAPATDDPIWLPSAFAGPPEGPLLAAPHDAVHAGEAGVWQLKAPAARIFQGPTGPRVLLVGLAATPLDVAGLSPAAARAAHPEARWFEVAVWWQVEGPAPPVGPP